ncbi:MAG: hypothetical protein JWN72_1634 [Thermoleophilia bacterium]|nr:hypothetical protein [Thermoleophilia bacterium]
MRRGARVVVAVEVLVAVAVVATIVWSVAVGDAPQLRTKAMSVRAVLYPLCLVIVPVGMWLRRRHERRRGAVRMPWPHLLAVLVTLPFAIDLVGNALDLYDSIEHFDDAIHLLNPVLFVIAVSLALAATGVPRWTVGVMAFGVGSTFHILWEMTEGQLLERIANVDLHISLADTLSDLAWGLVGSAVGVAVALVALRLGDRRVR